MARRIVEDMVVKGGKKSASKKIPREPSPFLQTLQKDLQKDASLRRASHQEPLRPPLPPQEPPFFPPQKEDRRGDSFFKKWYVFIALLIVGGGTFIFLSSRPLVVLSVTPRNEVKDIDLSFSATKDMGAGDIQFAPLEVEESATFSVPSTGSKDIDRRAQGQIIIFNSATKTVQALAARTRFESSNGKIFRITSPVRVPGYTTKDGKIIPGTLEVTVYADESGEEYNLAYTDFTLPGFKSNPNSYAKIVARSKTEMTGGFTGKIKLYDEVALLKEKAAYEKTLADNLLQKVKEKIPTESTLFSKALSFSYSYEVNDRVEKDKAEDPVTVTLTGTARGMLLKTADLYTLLAKNAFPEETHPIEVENISELTFALVNEDALSQKTLEVVSFTLRGKPRFVWTIPMVAIQKALAGSPKDAASYNAIFKSKFPTILSADVENFRPFWMQRFPSNPEKIVIEKVLP